MYCSNCGARLEENAIFCQECGFPAEKHKVDFSTISNSSKKRMGKPIIITIIAAVLLLVVLAVVMHTGVLSPAHNDIELGYKYLEEGNYEEAIIAFNKVLEIDPKNTEAIVGTVDAYVHLERFDDAIEFLDYHIEEDCENKVLHDKLIGILVDMGRTDEAIKAIERALKYGFEYEFDFMNDKHEENKKSSEFKVGRSVTEVNGKVITIDNGSIKVMNLETNEEKIVLEGNFDGNFVTDGNVLYFYDTEEICIKEVDLNTSAATKLTDVYTNADIEEGMESYYGYGELTAYADGYLYFEEWYGPADYETFVYSIKDNIYKKLEMGSYSIGDIDTYKDKIYYSELNLGGMATPLYEANADGSGAKVIVDYVVDFNVVGDKLYYSEQEEDNVLEITGKSTIKMYDLITKETTVLKDTVYGSAAFTDFGYGYGKTSEDDPYGINIIMDNGASIQKMGSISYPMSDDYIICCEDNSAGMPSTYSYNVVCDGKITKPIVLPSGADLLGYYGGRLYYRVYDDIVGGYGNIRSVTPVFEEN